jgi:hypothetical protein
MSAPAQAVSRYPWKRFWCPREGAISLADEGFVVDPEAEDWFQLNPHLRSSEEIAEVSCLALLGEPGIGKTTAMQDMVDAARRRSLDSSEMVLHLNLAGVSSDIGLIKLVFDDQTFTRWQAGDGTLSLFLDSLDEALAEVRAISAFFTQVLRRYDCERLRLRIACRGAEWPNSLDSELPGIFGAGNFQALELVPLRRRDVGEAAAMEGIEPGAFISELLTRDVVPFAITPVTLRFLINTYLADQALPASKNEIYRRGCLLLAEEQDSSRRERGGGVPGYHRLAIAERIAAAVMFAARDSVWVASDTSISPQTVVTIAELAGGKEGAAADVIAGASDVDVTESALRDTLWTALFNSHGANRLGFAHQTYAEFLAARYVLNRSVPREQVMAMLTAHADSSGRIVPQLQEVASWLAELDSDYLSSLLRQDPLVLLKSDVLLSDDEDRKRLVDEVLRLAEEGRLPRQPRGAFRKLGHAQIDDQLEPLILDADADRLKRRTAIDIAEEAAGERLAEPLVQVALRTGEDYGVRIGAAIASAQLGDDGVKERLKPLLTLPADEDPDDELRGAVLHTLWPHLMSLDELLAVLGPPHRPELIGLYTMFLSREVPANIKTEDLPKALEWAQSQPREQRLGPFDDLIDALVIRAFEEIHEEEIALALSRLTAKLIPTHHRLVVGASSTAFRDRMLADEGRRHLLLKSLIPHVAAGTVDAVQLDIAQEPFLIQQDVPYLIGLLDASDEADERNALASLIDRLYFVRSPHTELIVEASGRHDELASLLAPWLRPIDIDSTHAQELRERHRKVQDYEARVEPDPLTPPLDERVEGFLVRAEGGEVEAWWPLTIELSRESETPALVHPLKADIRSSPIWQRGSPELRQRIVFVAARYLRDADPFTDRWFGKNEIANAAIGGFRALRLLAEESAHELAALEASTWERWAATIVAFPMTGAPGDASAQASLIARAHQAVPDQVLTRIEQLIGADAQANRGLLVLRRITELHDQRLDEIAAAALRDSTLPRDPRVELLRFLLDRGASIGFRDAETLATPPLPMSEDERALSLQAASELFARGGEGQTVIWTFLTHDQPYRQAVIPILALDDRRGESHAEWSLDERQLGQLFRWTTALYPYSEDQQVNDRAFLGEREQIERWRDSLLTSLETKGTGAACAVLRELEHAFPDLDWLRAVVSRAEDNMRRQTWVPPKARDVIQMAHRPQLRFIQSGDHLLDVLIEALGRAQAELQGQTPAVGDLWNDLGRDYEGKRWWSPKTEPELSDWLARFLRRDLVGRRVVVNREVEIRRGAGAQLGDRTDIHVDAISDDPDAPQIVSAVIEVKGCWNRDLRTSLQEQLVEKYLNPVGGENGIYVVGWFASEKWQEGDRRRQQCERLDRGLITSNLEEQAATLSSTSAVLLRSIAIDLTLP